MSYRSCKVYSDGSHYIAIPPTKRKLKKREKKESDWIEVELEEEIENEGKKEVRKEKKRMNLHDYFEKLYKENIHLKKHELWRLLYDKFSPYFEKEEDLEAFIEANLKRKKRNMGARKIRLYRKLALQEFNYFCTFTYDSKLHTEESFRKKLSDTFKKLCYRRKWKGVGVWERSPEKQRLHFHALLFVPQGQMVGELERITDYNTAKRRKQTAFCNTYFKERFGRNDFKEIEDKAILGESIGYLLKYIEKSGERLVFYGDLPQFFVSDILDDDVLLKSENGSKLLLFDDFKCFDEGEYKGKVSEDVIKRMPKV